MATVRTQRRTWTLALPRAHFQEVVLARPQMLVFLTELAEQRARANAARGQATSDTSGRLSIV
jgi:CRP-like cAMP-binding protein